MPYHQPVHKLLTVYGDNNQDESNLGGAGGNPVDEQCIQREIFWDSTNRLKHYRLYHPPSPVFTLLADRITALNSQGGAAYNPLLTNDLKGLYTNTTPSNNSNNIKVTILNIHISIYYLYIKLAVEKGRARFNFQCKSLYLAPFLTLDQNQ